MTDRQTESDAYEPTVQYAQVGSIKRIADSWLTEINYVPDCVAVLWEGPQVKDADGQDWYILEQISRQKSAITNQWKSCVN